MTIGITPEGPSTAYGYIHAGSAITGSDDDAPASPQSVPTLAVESFVEKPDASTAATYVESGEYFWNAGMFVAKASVLLGALERFHPEIARPLAELAKRWDGDSREAAVRELWEPLPNAVIDRAIAEPLAAENGVSVVSVDMGWSDVGDYSSLAHVIDPAELSRQVSPGGEGHTTITIDSPESLIYTHSKPIVVIGIPEAVVVEMDDVILVTRAEVSQQVKNAVDSLGYAHLNELR